jgi:hypothetical protein
MSTSSAVFDCVQLHFQLPPTAKGEQKAVECEYGAEMGRRRAKMAQRGEDSPMNGRPDMLSLFASSLNNY